MVAFFIFHDLSFVVVDPSTCTLQRMQARVRDVGNSVGDRNLELNGCLELCESTPSCRSFVFVISQKQCQMKDKDVMGDEYTIRDPDSFTVYKKCDIGMINIHCIAQKFKTYFSI